jgi:hypothetical protein
MDLYRVVLLLGRVAREKYILRSAFEIRRPTSTYDGETRRLSVTLNGKMTCYVYGADGARLKKIENMAPAANCNAAPAAATPVTVYFANVEIRNYGQGAGHSASFRPAWDSRLTVRQVRARAASRSGIRSRCAGARRWPRPAWCPARECPRSCRNPTG